MEMNGDAKAEEAPKFNEANGIANGATKRGRVDDLIKQAKKPRRSSLGRGSVVKLDIPQPPGELIFKVIDLRADL